MDAARAQVDAARAIHQQAVDRHRAGVVAAIGRGVPKVALDADPHSGYRVIVNGKEQSLGGTSASALRRAATRGDGWFGVGVDPA